MCVSSIAGEVACKTYGCSLKILFKGSIKLQDSHMKEIHYTC